MQIDEERHFSDDFLLAIQIRWKFRLAVVQLLATKVQHDFAHVTTAQMCHVQNFVAIAWWKLVSEQKKIPSTLNRDRKKQCNGALERKSIEPLYLWYKCHPIPKVKCFSSRPADVFAQSIEARC